MTWPKLQAAAVVWLPCVHLMTIEFGSINKYVSLTPVPDMIFLRSTVHCVMVWLSFLITPSGHIHAMYVLENIKR